jgi:hypothetical protein
LRICDDDDTRDIVPRCVIKDPAECFDAGQKFHSVYAAFAASKVNYLFVRSVKMLREVNDGRTARIASRILVTGTVRVYVDGT